MEVTGRIPKDFTRVWMGVSAHKYLFIFLHCVYSWMVKQALIFQNHFAILDFSFPQARTELRKMKCCKENRQAVRVRTGFLTFLTWTRCTISHPNIVDLWAARGWTQWFSWQIPLSLIYLVFWVSNINGNTKNAEFESEFCLQNQNPYIFFWRAGNEQLPCLEVCVEVQVNKSKKKYSSLVPGVLLLAVFGKIITLLSVGHNDWLVFSPEAVATCWAFLLLFLLHSTRRGYSCLQSKQGFSGKGRKEPRSLS